jgi:hypothetical protein
VITHRNLLANIRSLDVLLLSTIQPVVFMLRFLYVFGGAIQAALPAAANGEYVYWLVPGILAQSAVFGSAPTAYGLNNDITKGVLDRFRSLPMARSAVLAGRTLSDLVRSTFILKPATGRRRSARLSLAERAYRPARRNGRRTRLRLRLLLADGLHRTDHPQQRSHPSRRLHGGLPDDPDQLRVPTDQDHARLAANLRRTPTGSAPSQSGTTEDAGPPHRRR